MYGVKTKVLNQAVKRNKDRFPVDFVFRLAKEDITALTSQGDMRSQFVTASRRNIRFLPYVFTEAWGRLLPIKDIGLAMTGKKSSPHIPYLSCPRIVSGHPGLVYSPFLDSHKSPIHKTDRDLVSIR